MNREEYLEKTLLNLIPEIRIKGKNRGKFGEQRIVNQSLKGFKGFSSEDVEDILEGTEGISDEKLEEFEDMIKRYIEESKEKIDTDIDKDIDLESKVKAMLKKLSKVNRDRIMSEVLGEIL